MENRPDYSGDIEVNVPAWRLHFLAKIVAIINLFVDAALVLFLRSVYSTIQFQVHHFHKQLEKYYVGPRGNVEHLSAFVAVVLLAGCILTIVLRRMSRILWLVGTMKILFIANLVLFWWAFLPWFWEVIIIGFNP